MVFQHIKLTCCFQLSVHPSIVRDRLRAAECEPIEVGPGCLSSVKIIAGKQVGSPSDLLTAAHHDRSSRFGIASLFRAIIRRGATEDRGTAATPPAVRRQ